MQSVRVIQVTQLTFFDSLPVTKYGRDLPFTCTRSKHYTLQSRDHFVILIHVLLNFNTFLVVHLRIEQKTVVR